MNSLVVLVAEALSYDFAVIIKILITVTNYKLTNFFDFRNLKLFDRDKKYYPF